MAEIESIVREFLSYLSVEKASSKHTVSNYARDLRRYTNYLHTLNVEDFAEISESQAQGFAIFLSKLNPPLAKSSIARAVVAVRSLHRFALTEGLIQNNVMAQVKPPKIASRLPKALNLNTVLKLLEMPNRNTPLGLRDAALLELLYGTGARISEILALQVDDVTGDLADQGLRLLGKGRKERIVPVGSYALAAIQSWVSQGRASLGPHTSALFLNKRGQKLSRQSAWGILQEYARALEIQLSPHTLRHSFATHLLDGGADIRVVQELLGHASVATTQIYTKVTAQHLREVFLEAHPRAR